MTLLSNMSSTEQSAVGLDSLRVSVRKVLSTSFELAVDFAVSSGIHILFGPSGAGKTTLLDCIAGISTPNSGRVSVLEVTRSDEAR